MQNYVCKVLSVLVLFAICSMYGCSEKALEIDENNPGLGKLENMATATYSLDKVSATTASFSGNLKMTESDLQYFTRLTILYSDSIDDGFDFETAETASTVMFDSNQGFSIKLNNLKGDTRYKYCVQTECQSGNSYSKVSEFRTKDFDFEQSSPANCHIASEPGIYRFPMVIGNSNESVGVVAAVDVLWESFGSFFIKPEPGDLISKVYYKDRYMYIQLPEPFHTGNAVVTAKDVKGTILWSWHIWMTDTPQEQVYFNDAGIMMDRNLGATSVEPKLGKTEGLYYQWGRKDPFSDREKTTNGFIQTSSSDALTYSIKEPSWWLSNWPPNNDYEGWAKEKTIYDPCPAGWKVPKGGESGIWKQALGDKKIENCEQENGFNFSGLFSSNPLVWYPKGDFLFTRPWWLWGDSDGQGYYWSISSLYHLPNSEKNIDSDCNLATTCYVRCQKE
ncbi:MAG: hypothetical protein MR690_00635 [Rikenellaceae bacterium]|nr:hypothetical protein [Rikenellaceae bacterium]